MVVVAGIMAAGATVAAIPAAAPTEAIPRATTAREAIAEAVELIGAVEEEVEGADLVDRDPERAVELLAEAHAAIDRALGVGVAAADLAPLRGRIGGRLDALYRVTRVERAAVVADLAAAFDDVEPAEMVAANDGSLWVLESGRGRVFRIDPADGTTTLIYRAGQELASGAVPAAPWLIATAATDVVVIDRARTAWRIDLTERIPRRMEMNGLADLSAETALIGALQHRPPLEIFNLYAVNPETGGIDRWSPPAVIPVTYPDPPEPFLTGEPDLDPRQARDLRVDVNAWLLHADDRHSHRLRVAGGPGRLLARPATRRGGSTSARLPAARRCHGRRSRAALCLRRGRARGSSPSSAPTVPSSGSGWRPRTAPSAGSLDDVRALSVASVADGPPAAYLLTADGVVRLVLE